MLPRLNRKKSGGINTELFSSMDENTIFETVEYRFSCTVARYDTSSGRLRFPLINDKCMLHFSELRRPIHPPTDWTKVQKIKATDWRAPKTMSRE